MPASHFEFSDAVPLLAGHEIDVQGESSRTAGTTTMAESKGVARFLRTLKGQQASNPEGAFAAKLELPSENSSTFAPDEEADKTTTDLSEASLEPFYVPIDSYEGRHRYDPRARWTEAEEKALVRKVCNAANLVFVH